MSVYKKLAEARVKLQEKGLTKSGKNKFAGYEYFELEDFLPVINTINKDLGLCTIVSYSTDNATLRIVDTDKPDEVIEITSPMRDATLKGCHDIQNLGAVESYQRRYLYMTAYEIAENDTLNATTGKETAKTGTKTLTDAQIKRLYALGYKAGFDKKKVVEQVYSKFKCSPEMLNKTQYDTVCNGYEKI